MENTPDAPQMQQPAAAQAVDERVRLRGIALAGVLASLVMTLLLAALDQSIVSTALPHIITDLHGGYDQLSWIVTAYLLTSTTVIPIISKFSDQFGRKWFLVAGVVVFLAGSALCGTANDLNQLILYRGLQGFGGGAIMSQVFTLIGDIFTPAERARWQGLFTGVFVLASVIGPTLGGWITDNTSWRWIFYINLPVGVIALLLLIFQLPTHISLRSSAYRGWAAIRRIDFLGALTAAGATVCLLLGLTWGGQTYPWDSVQVIATLTAAVVLFVAFFIVERYATEPILPLDLFRNQVFAAGSLLALMVGMTLFSVIIYLPLFIQAVLKQSATNSGAVITPMTLAMGAGAVLIGFVIARIGRYQLIAIVGALVMTVGIFLFSQMNASTTIFEVTRNMIVVGVGMGLLQPVMTLAVQNAIPRTRLGVGTGAVTYLRSMGSTLGVAIIGSVVNNTVTTELAKRLPAGASRLPQKLVSPAALQQVLISPSAQQSIIDKTATVASQQAVAQAVPPAVSQAVQQAVAQAVATHRIPATGPAHDQAVAAITQQVTQAVTPQVTQAVTTQVTQAVTTLFHQIFEASRMALAVGIEQAFKVGLIMCGVVILITFFLKDVPLVTRSSARKPGEGGTAAADDEPAPALIEM